MKSNWKTFKLDEFIAFNPKETLKKGTFSKKIAMDILQPFCRDISNYEVTKYTGGTKFRNGDTIMARITPCLENGKTAKINILDTDEIGFGSTEYIVLRAIPNISNEDFIYYLTCSPIIREPAIKSMVGSSGRQRVQINVLQNLEINLPPLETQKKIASILSALDDKIELNNKINENLEMQAQAIFDNMFPNVIYGEHSIGEYITPKRGKNLLSKNTIFGNVPVVAGGLEPSTYHNKSNTIAPVLTISASGANAGYVNLWTIPVWASDSSFIDFTMTENVYFWYVMLKKRQKEIFESQTGSAQPHIYPKHIAILPVIKLNQIDISKFTNIVTPLFNKIGNNKIENQRLAELRDTLLPKLMNGEIDVDDVQVKE